MSCVDEALLFDCAGEDLVGVLSLPQPANMRDHAVLVIVGGPQYRAGSHRQFVLLARSLAQAGYPTLRFDVRGMGDSGGHPRGFEALDSDIAAAVECLHARLPGLRGVVLWGLCDGASAALMYWLRTRDSRIHALALLNPWLRSDAGQARTRVKHYYSQRLLQRAFWSKLLRGKVAWQALCELRDNLRLARAGTPETATPAAGSDFRQQMAAAWMAFTGPILWISSGNDYTAKEFEDGLATKPAWRGALSRQGLCRISQAQADHTFSATAERLAMQAAVHDWLDAVCSPAEVQQVRTRPVARSRQ